MAEQGSGSNGAAGEFARLMLVGLVGALVGAALGLLLAPKPGAELRSELKERAGTAAEKAHVVQVRARELVETAKQKLEERRAAGAGEEEEAGEQEAEA